MNRPTGRAKIEHVGNDIKITVPANKNVLFPLFMIFWFGGWYFGYRMALQHPSFFISIWLCGWFIAGLFMILMVLWVLFGYEHLTISKSKLYISTTVFGLSYSKTLYKRELIGAVYFEDQKSTRKARPGMIYLIGPGKIKFRAYNRTYAFGGILDDNEAIQLVKLINDKLFDQLQD